MKKYTHKKIEITGENRNDGFLHFGNGKTIPIEFILNGNDWKEIIEEKSCYAKVRSVQRNDGVVFSIGDTIKVDKEGASFNHIITEFYNIEHKDVCFTCIKTKETNGFSDELINIDVIKHIKNTGIMTKQCLCIQDYIDVLQENKKAFLFQDTMVKFLKAKIQ